MMEAPDAIALACATWFDTHGSWPRGHSDNQIERRLGRALDTADRFMREGCAGTVILARVAYWEYEGLPWQERARQSEPDQVTDEVIVYYRQHRTVPAQVRGDRKAKRLASAVYRVRRADAQGELTGVLAERAAQWDAARVPWRSEKPTTIAA